MNDISLPVTRSDEGGSVLLHPPGPFSFEQTLGYMTRSANECMYRVENGQILRLIPAGDCHLFVRIGAAGDGALRIEIPDGNAGADPANREIAARYVWEWFDLGRNLASFYELAERDEVLARTLGKLYGLRIVGFHDLFEALCWGIMGQQINLAFAYTLKRRFVETFGRSEMIEDRRYWIFPEPERIAALNVGDLTPLQLTGKKSEYLIGVAGLIAGGELSRQKLLALGDMDAIERALVRIRGIGPWTAHYVLMRCLRLQSAFPAADVGLHNALKHMLGREDKPAPAEIAQLAAGWKGWESYATFYLWRMID